MDGLLSTLPLLCGDAAEGAWSPFLQGPLHKKIVMMKISHSLTEKD